MSAATLEAQAGAPGAADGLWRRGAAAESPASAGWHLPALDGVRAVAVLAVLAYHAGVPGVRGGLLGVDIFFVLSGFLITTLLVDEHLRDHRIDLLAFWGRRARRLLPALLVLLAGMTAYARWCAPAGTLGQLRGDAVATLAYVANWHFVFSGQGYFVHYGAPSPLLHTWSLAVEEQYYLLWPVAAWWALRRGGARRLAAVAGTGMVLSATLTAALYLAGAGQSRLYYGTDTRAQALLAGALLAAILAVRPHSQVTPRVQRGLTAAGWAGVLTVLWCLHAVSGSGPFTYLGGFLLVAVATSAVLGRLAVGRAGRLGRFLTLAPLGAIGRWSYGIYLYHWPLFLLIDNRRTGWHGPLLLAARLGATLALAAASYRFVEKPVRAGARRRRWPVRVAAPAGAVVSVALVLATVTPAAVAAPPRPPTPAPALSRAATPHVRALLVGDSLALMLGLGLGRGSARWGVSIDNRATLGCDLDPASTVEVMGQVMPAATGCPSWRTAWMSIVADTHPDVVMVLLGRWEVLDRRYQGHWTHIGRPDWDRHLSAELDEVIDILSSHQATVVLLTLPYVAQTTEQPDGRPWPVNEPGRTDDYNAVVRAAAARHPGTAKVLDLNRLLDPAGHYTSFIDGVRVRSTDDEHISVAGGQWLQAWLLPELVAVADKRGQGAGREGIAPVPWFLKVP